MYKKNLLASTLFIFIYSNAICQISNYGIQSISFSDKERNDTITISKGKDKPKLIDTLTFYETTYIARSTKKVYTEERYYLSMADHHEKISIEYQKAYEKELERLFESNEDSDVKDKKKDELEETYFKKRDEFHLKAVKYWAKYRSFRACQLFPLFYGKDLSQRSELFYENTINDKQGKLLSSINLNLGLNGKVSSYSEVYQDYFGPLRFSAGMLITNNTKVTKDSSGLKIIDESERKEDALQRIIGGGGNFITSLSTPILLIKNPNDRFRFLNTLNAKASLDVPSIGTYNSDFNFKSDFGFESTIIFMGKKENVALYGINRLGFIWGNASLFKYLDFDRKSHTFFMHTFQVGLSFVSMFRIGVNFCYGDPYVVKNFPVAISTTFVPR